MFIEWVIGILFEPGVIFLEGLIPRDFRQGVQQINVAAVRVGAGKIRRIVGGVREKVISGIAVVIIVREQHFNSGAAVLKGFMSLGGSGRFRHGFPPVIQADQGEEVAV